MVSDEDLKDVKVVSHRVTSPSILTLSLHFDLMRTFFLTRERVFLGFYYKRQNEMSREYWSEINRGVGVMRSSKN